MRVARDSVTLFFFFPFFHRPRYTLAFLSTGSAATAGPSVDHANLLETLGLVGVGRLNEALAKLQPPRRSCGADANVLFHTGGRIGRSIAGTRYCGNAAPLDKVIAATRIMLVDRLDLAYAWLEFAYAFSLKGRTV